MAVIDAGRTGGLAGTAAQASIKVFQHLGIGRAAFEKLFHLVNSTTRTIELVAG